MQCKGRNLPIIIASVITLADGVSFTQCKRCYLAKNHGNNTRDEYGAAIAIYRVNQFENGDVVTRYEFIDWYDNYH